MSSFGLWQRKNKMGHLYLYGKSHDQIMIIYKNFFRTSRRSPHFRIKFVNWSGIHDGDLKTALEKLDFGLDLEQMENIL